MILFETNEQGKSSKSIKANFLPEDFNFHRNFNGRFES